MKYRLCSIHEISDPGSKEFELKINDTPLNCFVVHHDTQFYAYQNTCPHTGAPLNWQPDQFLDRDMRLIQCAVHDALFEIDSGYCVAGPCSGQTLKALTLEIEEDDIILVI